MRHSKKQKAAFLRWQKRRIKYNMTDIENTSGEGLTNPAGLAPDLNGGNAFWKTADADVESTDRKSGFVKIDKTDGGLSKVQIESAKSEDLVNSGVLNNTHKLDETDFVGKVESITSGTSIVVKIKRDIPIALPKINDSTVNTSNLDCPPLRWTSTKDVETPMDQAKDCDASISDDVEMEDCDASVPNIVKNFDCFPSVSNELEVFGDSILDKIDPSFLNSVGDPSDKIETGATSPNVCEASVSNEMETETCDLLILNDFEVQAQVDDLILEQIKTNDDSILEKVETKMCEDSSLDDVETETRVDSMLDQISDDSISDNVESKDDAILNEIENLDDEKMDTKDSDPGLDGDDSKDDSIFEKDETETHVETEVFEDSSSEQVGSKDDSILNGINDFEKTKFSDAILDDDESKVCLGEAKTEDSLFDANLPEVEVTDSESSTLIDVNSKEQVLDNNPTVLDKLEEQDNLLLDKLDEEDTYLHHKEALVLSNLDDQDLVNLNDLGFDNLDDTDKDNLEDKCKDNVEDKCKDNLEDKCKDNLEDKCKDNFEDEYKYDFDNEDSENLDDKYTDNHEDNFDVKDIENLDDEDEPEDKCKDNLDDKDLKNLDDKDILEDKCKGNLEDKFESNLQDEYKENLDDKDLENLEDNLKYKDNLQDKDNIDNKDLENIDDEDKNNLKDSLEGKYNDNLQDKYKDNLDTEHLENLDDEDKNNLEDKHKDNLQDKFKTNLQDKCEDNRDDKVSENLGDEDRDNLEDKFKDNIDDEDLENLDDDDKDYLEDSFTDNLDDEDSENLDDVDKDYVEGGYKGNIDEEDSEYLEDKYNDNLDDKENDNLDDKDNDNLDDKDNDNLDDKDNDALDDKDNDNLDDKDNDNLDDKDNDNIDDKDNDNLDDKDNDKLDDKDNDILDDKVLSNLGDEDLDKLDDKLLDKLSADIDEDNVNVKVGGEVLETLPDDDPMDLESVVDKDEEMLDDGGNEEVLGSKEQEMAEVLGAEETKAVKAVEQKTSQKTMPAATSVPNPSPEDESDEVCSLDLHISESDAEDVCRTEEIPMEIEEEILNKFEAGGNPDNNLEKDKTEIPAIAVSNNTPSDLNEDSKSNGDKAPSPEESRKEETENEDLLLVMDEKTTDADETEFIDDPEDDKTSDDPSVSIDNSSVVESTGNDTNTVEKDSEETDASTPDESENALDESQRESNNEEEDVNDLPNDDFDTMEIEENEIQVSNGLDASPPSTENKDEEEAARNEKDLVNEDQSIENVLDENKENVTEGDQNFNSVLKTLLTSGTKHTKGQKGGEVEKVSKSTKRQLVDQLDDETAKRQKLISESPPPATTLTKLGTFKEFMLDKTLKGLTRDQLEVLCIQKMCESIRQKSEIGELKVQIKSQQQILESLRKEAVAIGKQTRDLGIVFDKINQDVATWAEKPDRPLSVPKITRSVGLQAVVKDDIRRKSKPPASPIIVNKPKSPRIAPANNSPSINQPPPPPTTPKFVGIPKNVIAKKVKVPVQNRTPPAKKNDNKGVIDLTDDDDKKAPAPAPSPAPKAQNGTKVNMINAPNGHKYVVMPNGQTVMVKLASPNIVVTQSIRSVVPVKGRGNYPPQNTYSPSNNRQLTPKIVKHPAPLPSTPPCNVELSKPAPPPKPQLMLNKTACGTGIILSWKMPYNLDLFEQIASYQLFAYQETKSDPKSDTWGKIGDVKALELPMAVTLTQFAVGNRYYFAVRAVDVLKRYGPFSEYQTILL